MELYNANNMPLSNNPKLKNVQEKIINGQSVTVMEKIIAGRDHPIKNLGNYNLKPDHAYRAVSEKLFNIYKEKGFIIGTGIDDEYEEHIENGQTINNNKGVDWYLGGVDLKYGAIIIECPADKEYFTPAFDNGNGMSYDPSVRFLKSSGAKKPIPMTMITNVFDARELKQQNDKTNLESFKKVREKNRDEMSKIRIQQLSSLKPVQETQELVDNIQGGKSR